jgi:hypothetical protein
MDADKYPAARLILHVMEQQEKDHGGLPFNGGTQYPETDGNNQYNGNTAECVGGNTVSKSWITALNEFANVPKNAGTITPREVVADYKNIISNPLSSDQGRLAEKVFDAMYAINDGKGVKTFRNLTEAKDLTKYNITGRPANTVVNEFQLNQIYKPDARTCGTGGDRDAINGTHTGGPVYASTGKLLDFNPDKALLTQLLDRAYQKASTTSTGATSTNFFSGSSTGSVPEDKDIIFYRKMGEPNALYRKVGGVEIRVEKGSDEFMKLKNDGNCYTTGYTGNGKGVSCANLVSDCLKGTNIADCKSYMRSKDWNDQLENEKISPEIALDLLRKFGFGTKTVTVNEIGRNLEMIEDYDDWMTNLTKNFTGTGQLSQDDLTQIAANTPLTGYLKKLISLINRNPGILNRDYVGKANLTQNPNAFASTQLGRFGLLPKQVLPASGVPTMSSVLSLQNAVMSNRNQIGMNWGIMPQGIIFQRGGGMSSGIAEVLENAQNNSSFPLKLSKLMEDSFKSFVTSLKSHGKDLDSGDKQHIEKLVLDLQEKEDKLFKAAIYTDKYVRLIGALGQTDSNTVVSLDHAKQFVDRRNSYLSKVGKKQDDLFSILKALAEAQQQETTVENKPVTNYPRF